jgi:hypothetical protein
MQSFFFFRISCRNSDYHEDGYLHIPAILSTMGPEYLGLNHLDRTLTVHQARQEKVAGGGVHMGRVEEFCKVPAPIQGGERDERLQGRKPGR